ncbi:hypothetical protein [Paracoccus sp. ME4]|uniref:hypothetical protein n=1 Tax=Paracoccus sp. ME4 TaxID=3138066 RepID=UPI00398B5A3A
MEQKDKGACHEASEGLGDAATLLTVGVQAGLARAARAALIEGRSDMVLSILSQDDPDIRRTDILHDHHVVAMRSGTVSTSGAGRTGRMSSSRAGARRAVRWMGSWPNGASAAGRGWSCRALPWWRTCCAGPIMWRCCPRAPCGTRRR